ncbi:hypothetical protein OXIME_000490 [Oxyplasma meridianum]|uniref:DUF1453 domain-containing protein n=1 Tax=Oxyplasma meridianum TaxID=3073602 RepID=A0AAX4NFI6_9ARCH
MVFPYSSVSSSPSPSFYSYLILLVIIALIAFRRVSRGVNGTQFRKSRVLRGPVMYSILTVIFIFVLSPFNYDIYATILFLPIGLLFGMRFGGSVSFFKRDNIVFYKRNQVILAFWLLSFMARIVLEILYPNIIFAEMIVDALLALTSGLITGEAAHILNKEKIFATENSVQLT